MVNYDKAFTPALSAVLNADRDLYQALTALQRLVYRQDLSQIESFEENAKQVKDRYKVFNQLMLPYQQVMGNVSGFDQAFDQWLTNSHTLVNQAKTGGAQSDLSMILANTYNDFENVRDILDKAGESIERAAASTTSNINDEVDQMQFIEQFIVFLAIIIAAIISYISPKHFS